jgi:Flp pilus assembly protein TadG
MTLLHRLSRSGGAYVKKFATARDGLAAVEFAIISPLLITMYFGVTEIADAFTASTKATAVASTAADLIAQEKVVCNAEMNDAFAALNAIMFPFPVSGMQIRISSLIDAGGGTVKVAWSDAQNMSPRAVNSVVTVPTGLVASGGSVIMSEINYSYNSPTGHMIYGTITLSDKFYLHPRRTSQITRTATTC